MYLDLLHNIIFGIKCKQVVDFDKSTTTVKEERNKTLQWQMTDKYHHFQVVTLAPNQILLK